MSRCYLIAIFLFTKFFGEAVAGDPKYVGDVPGRALSFIGLEGHIGVWTGSYVIEMQTEGIQTPSLTSFKTAAYNANYYGAKGIGQFNRYGVTSAIFSQQQFNPTYTYFAEYWPGGVFAGKKFDYSTMKWKDVYRQFSGKFRCDTLVDYAYKTGYGSYITPMTARNNKEFTSATEYYVRIKGYTKATQSISPNKIYEALPDTR